MLINLNKLKFNLFFWASAFTWYTPKIHTTQNRKVATETITQKQFAQEFLCVYFAQHIIHQTVRKYFHLLSHLHQCQHILYHPSLKYGYGIMFCLKKDCVGVVLVWSCEEIINLL